MSLAVIRALLLVVLAALAGCPEGDAPLAEAPGEAAAQSRDAEQQAPDDTQSADATEEAGDGEAPAADTASEPVSEPPSQPETEPVAEEPPPDPDAIFRAECAKIRKGQATRIGSGRLVCVRTPRDAGKHCTSSKDCRESLCLARSQTCAPITPLYGCYEILSATGARQNYCRE